MTAPTLELRGVTHRFGSRVALDDVSFTARAGTVVGLLGPNGAGKTTLINVAAGLTKPTAGEVQWRGEPVSYPFPKAVRREIGLLPQTNALYDELSVVQNLRFAGELYGVTDLDRRVADVVAL